MLLVIVFVKRKRYSMLVKVSFRFCTLALSVVCLALTTQSVLQSWWMLSTPTLADVEVRF
jgi:hypothetical protein